MERVVLKEHQKALRNLIKKCNNTEDKLEISRIARGVKETNNPYLICDFMASVPKAHTKELIKMFEDEIEDIGDIVHSYEFMFLMSDMKVQNFEKKRFEELIKSSGNPKLMMYCLGFVEGIDKESMLQALYETKNAKYIELLSTSEDYEDFNVSERPEYFEMLKRAKEFNYFPRSLEEYREENPNLVTLISSIVKSDSETVEQRRKKAYQINELANYIEYLAEYHGKDYDAEFLHTSINLLQDAELVAGDDEPLHLYEFAASVETDDKSSVINRVIDIGDKKYIHYCLEYVPNVPQNLVEKMEKVLKQEEAVKPEMSAKPKYEGPVFE